MPTPTSHANVTNKKLDTLDLLEYSPHLASNYADGFFAREAPRDDEPTIDEVKETILTLEARLVEHRAQLERLEDEAEAERQAEAARLAQATQADELEAQAKALLEQAAELKKRAKK